MTKRVRRIWIDLENTPHVPFFVPIVNALRADGFDVILTAREFAQTVEMAQAAGLAIRVIGRGGAAGALRKSLAVVLRALRLAVYLRNGQVDLAVSHGSRGMLLAAKLLRIPSLTLYDYEGASVQLFNRWSTYVMTPELLTDSILQPLGLNSDKHLTYPGLKEEVYLGDAMINSAGMKPLGIDPNQITVVVRPPSDTAHYRSDESTQLFAEVMCRLLVRSDVRTILLPRDAAQRRRLTEAYDASQGVTIPDGAVDGPSLLAHTDLVIGGGGTMNREAAVLGVPVLSIFKGPEGAVDRWLKEQGLLYDVHRPEEIDRFLTKRSTRVTERKSAVLRTIVSAIEECAGGATTA